MAAITRVAVVLPSGAPPPERLEAGLAWLRDAGIAVVPPWPRPAGGPSFLAGDDDLRAAELVAALRDADVDAIWCGRGGVGALRTLTAIDNAGLSAALGARPSLPLIGLSDATPLLLARAARGGAAIHGPVGIQLPRLALGTDAAMRAWLREPSSLPSLVAAAGGARRGCRAEGRVIAGNLAMLAATTGTPEQPSLDGALLLLEDIGEPDWRIDRFMAQLERAGALRGLRGLGLGTFEGCSPEGGAEAVLLAWADRLGISALAGLPFGHGADVMPIAIGRHAVLDVDQGIVVQGGAPPGLRVALEREPGEVF